MFSIGQKACIKTACKKTDDYWMHIDIPDFIHGESLDDVRKQEYARLSGKGRSYIKGQKHTLLSNQENLDLSGRQTLKKLLGANKRLNAAYLLKESFGQMRSYQTEGWARRFFDNWKQVLT